MTDAPVWLPEDEKRLCELQARKKKVFDTRDVRLHSASIMFLRTLGDISPRFKGLHVSTETVREVFHALHQNANTLVEALVPFELKPIDGTAMPSSIWPDANPGCGVIDVTKDGLKLDSGGTG